MIRLISIKNFALAENLTIEFGEGLNIVTGETGAGKSVLVGAIAAVLGGRVYSEVVRTGSEKACVEAVIDISRLSPLKALLRDKGLDAGDELILRREIAVKGSSRGFVNDSPVTISALAEVGDHLIDIHGQHEHQSLLRRETHRGVIDLLGHHEEQLNRTAESFTALINAQRKLKELKSRQKTLTEKYELYDFQYREIADADLSVDEEAALDVEHKRLANIEKLLEISSKLSQLFIGEEEGILGRIAAAGQLFEGLREYSPELDSLYKEFSTARIVFDECAGAVDRFQSGLEFDPERFQFVEERLKLISRLKKKYGDTIGEVLAYQEEIFQNLQLKDNFEAEIAQLEQSLAETRSIYQDAATALSLARKETANKMANMVAEQLAYLGMPRMVFEIRIEHEPDPNGVYESNGQSFAGDADGIDRVEFYISPNPGERAKPLGKIASGGELSRIMLALKTILAGIDAIPTLIFDEVDSGVSGRVAQAVGRSIAELSNKHQIICITHLAQIASHGDAHYSVEKYVEEDRTFTRITALDESQRTVEIARLIAGDNITDTVLESAKQLIREGR